MAKKTIDDYLPEKGERRSLTVDVDETLYERVNDYRRAKGITWVELMTALFSKLMDEVGKESRSA